MQRLKQLTDFHAASSESFVRLEAINISSSKLYICITHLTLFVLRFMN